MLKFDRDVLLAVVMALCLWSSTAAGAALAASLRQEPGTFTLQTLKNAEYRTQYTPSRTVKLSDGVYDDPNTGLHIELTDTYTFGDLNGDGVDDAAAILVATVKDGAPFFELVALTNQGGQSEIGGLILLGEGVQVKNLSIANGAITVDYLRPQPGDPACCPSRTVTEGFFSRRGLLVPKQARAFGQLFPYQDGLLYGYVNVLGETVIEPQFVLAGAFSEGMAPVSYDGKTTGFINQLGELVIEAKFSYAGAFVQGFAMVGVPGVDADAPFLTAYIDRVGRFVFGDQRFRSAEPFSEGLAAVSYDGERFGYMDLLGNLIIEPQFRQAESFSEGLAPVQFGDQYGYIDRTGKFVIDPQFEAAEPFRNGLARITLGGKTGYINHAGQIVIEPAFDYGSDFAEGRALVSQAGKLLYIDEAGNAEIDIPNLTHARDFAEGLAAVAVGDQYGYIDLKGNFFVPPQFSYAGDFQNGLAVVETPHSWALLNSIGEIVLEIDRFQPATAAKTTTPQTQLIEYIPAVPQEARAGVCTANSEILDLASAWQCTVDGTRFDPCLVAGDGQTVVCGPSPMQDYPGFRLALEKPLPAVNVAAQPPSDIWQLRTADDALCEVSRMADMQVNGQRLTHICDDGTALFGAIDRSGELWTVEKATLVNQANGAFTLKDTQQVQIVQAWQPIEPKP
jgi:hypothetical protein